MSTFCSTMLDLRQHLGSPKASSKGKVRHRSRFLGKPGAVSSL